jgi:predicted PurR-regulated permease PerM
MCAARVAPHNPPRPTGEIPSPPEAPSRGGDSPRDSALQATSSMRYAVWALALIAIACILYLTASLLLPIMVAGTLALLLSPAVNALNRLRLPQPVSAGIVMLIVLIVLGGLAINVAGPVQRWIETAPNQLRKLENRVSALMGPLEAVREATEKVSAIAADDSKPKPREVVVAPAGLSSALNFTVNTLIMVLSTVMLAYFLLACGDVLMRKLIIVTPDREGKLRMLGILRTIQLEIGRYFATITLVNAGLGIATGMAMWALGMPTPLVWGVAVALLNFLPYLGPLSCWRRWAC